MQLAEPQTHIALAILQYAAPLVVVLYCLGATATDVCTLHGRRKHRRNRTRRFVTGGMGFILLTYLLQSGLLLIDTFSANPRISSLAANVNATSSVLLWLVLNVLLYQTKRPVWHPYYGSWLILLAFEVTTFCWFTSQHTLWKAADIALVIICICRLAAAVSLTALFVTAEVRAKRLRSDEESASLLGRQVAKSARRSEGDPAGDYGAIKAVDATPSSTDSEDSEPKSQADKEDKKRQRLIKKRLKEDGNWFTYVRGFSIFIPMIWPSKQPRLYINVAGCVLCILCGRVLNIMLPRQFGIIINILTSGSDSLYEAIGVYMLFRWAASGAGVDLVRQYLWFPVDKYSYISMTTAAYNQIMELSCEFHDNKRSGELYRSIDQGSSINDLLDLMLFELGPMIVDICAGFGYLYHLFGPYMALLALATTVTYVSTMVPLNIKQSSIRREYLALVRKQYQVMFDSLGNWTTVSYFNHIRYEENKFKDAVLLHIIKRQLYYGFNLLNLAVGSLVMNIGLYGALLLAAYQVTHGSRSVGDFVTLLSYWSIYTCERALCHCRMYVELTILVAPLKFFVTMHKRVLQDLVAAEQLLQLFREKNRVKDGDRKFILQGGAVQFKDVHFSYDGSKQIISGLNFTATPGQKIALVGETGGGKSTLLKLLFRFYDVTEGSLLVDGQDVRDVTLESLRSCIGVVPQNPSMFNDTIMNNVRYSRLDATEVDVTEACKAAAVHDKILSFTDGYSSKVGENGVKLSGGELQRLAIARAILKDPSIILLDEATSSVDTDTETRIQSALAELTKGRTTFTVAHRLSTVVDADVILVIKDGMILEHGSPKDLLAAKGKYYDLWCKQVGIALKAAETTADEAEHDRHHDLPEDEQARPGSSEQKKIWRPDAPEFVPRHLQSKAQPETPDISQQGQETADSKAELADRQGKREDATSMATPKAGQHQQATNDTIMAATVTSIDDAAGKEKDDVQRTSDAPGTDSDPDRKRARLARARRRRMSKSEPSGSSMSAGDGDGAITPHDVREGPNVGPATERRRVSAPSKTPSSGGGKSAGQGRRNRQKQGRSRQQNSTNTQSETRSARTSGTWSAGTGMPTPSASSTTPENNDGLDSKSGDVGKGNVRFAQDT
ncbi:MAG: hypothetical protein Q9170_001013 [Blastenia crenularia]